MQPPKIYILIENPSKSNNLGPILRCGAAYSATFIFVGYQKCACDGSHGANKHVEIVSYPTFPQAVDYIKNSCGVNSIVGVLGDVTFRSEDGSGDNNDDNAASRMVYHDLNFNTLRVSLLTNHNTQNKEVDILQSCIETNSPVYPCSKPIHTRPFCKDENICFLISKKSLGLPAEQGAFCDAFVHISTGAPIVSPTDHTLYGLLDCQTCLSICLHHFAAFADYKERDFIGQKFQVNNLHISSLDIDRDDKCRALKEERQNRKLQIEKDAQDAW